MGELRRVQRRKQQTKEANMKKNTSVETMQKVENKVAKQYVKELNKLAVADYNSWLEIGELVDQAAKEIREQSRRKNPDVYRILADSPDSILQSGQLRNHHTAWQLRNEISRQESAPNVPLTHWVVVISAKLNLSDSEKFLRMAEEENLSVNELKNRIEANNGTDDDPNPSFEYKDSIKRLGRGLSKVSDCLSKAFELSKGNPMPPEIKQQILFVVQFSLQQGIVSLAEVTGGTEGGNHEG